MRRQRIVHVLVIVAIMLLPSILVASEGVARQPDVITGPDGSVMLSPEETRLLMAQWYTEIYPVSLDEALRRLELQGFAADLQATLFQVHRNVVTGVRIEHTPEFRVVVSVVEGFESLIQPYFVIDELAGLVVTEAVSKTHEQLQADLDRTGDILALLGVESASAIGPEHVEIYLPDPDRLIELLEAHDLELPSSVKLINMPLPQQGDYLGGFAITTGCTSGFTGYYAPSGAGGVFTAAHCGGTNCCDIRFEFDMSQTLPFWIDRYGGSSDWQFNSNTTTHDLRNMINIGSTWIPITGLRFGDRHTGGTFVCKFGRATLNTCGSIHRSNFDPDGDQQHFWAPTFTITAAFSRGGDSGGPLYGGDPHNRNSAFGINWGYAGNNSVFMSIDWIYAWSYRIYYSCGSDYNCSN